MKQAVEKNRRLSGVGRQTPGTRSSEGRSAGNRLPHKRQRPDTSTEGIHLVSDNVWGYRSDAGYQQGSDLTGFKVEATDGSIGKVDSNYSGA